MSNKIRNIIAFVYLLSEGDERNKCLLTSDSLILIRKNKTYTFQLEEVKKLGVASRLFLFPLVFGGTFGPFFFIAIIKNSFLPVISLTGFLVSLLAFYLGFSGKKAFYIETLNDKKEIYLSSISENLSEFIRFINEIVITNEKEETLTFYLKLIAVQKQELIQNGELKVKSEGEFLIYSSEKEKYDNSHLLIPVNYTIPTIQIKFEKNDQNMLRPKIYGTLKANHQLISPHLA